jgi:hypothetical protein
MKPIRLSRLVPRRGYIRTAASALALSAVIMGFGFSARTATINREKVPWETRHILSGIVSDSVCGKGHTINRHGDRECTRLCVKLGANYALVVGKSLFILKGHEAELDEFAGQSVIVTGAVSRDTVRVESVAPLYLRHRAASSEVE